jgi:outer membrane lipoprotein-sorting protein
VHVLGRQRVIHISRVTLLPYEQDLYDEQGRVVTTITYSKYQKFGDLDYPMSIFLKRPLDEYTLQIDITKLTLNQPLDDEDFKLTIPDGIPIQHM